METEHFGTFPRGTLYEMLLNAYRDNAELTARDAASWKTFDDFVYDRLDILEHCGFVSMKNGVAVGFITWDPRGLPEKIEVGHNCILPAYRDRGLGKAQLAEALVRMKSRNPRTIRVLTGTGPFFLPARRMYEGQGFIPTGEEAPSGCVLYRLVPETAL